MIELCQHFDLKIVNGRFGSDKGHGDWTCVTANGSSVVDYVIMSSSMMQYVSNFVVNSYDPCMSDVHKPLQVMLTQQSIGAIDVPNIFVENDDYQVNGLQHNMLKTKWVSNCSEQYKRNFVSLDIEDMSRTLSEVRTRSDVTQLEIDDICKGINNVLIKPAIVSGISSYKRPTVNCIRKRANQYINNPWCSKECKVKRREYLSKKID